VIHPNNTDSGGIEGNMSILGTTAMNTNCSNGPNNPIADCNDPKDVVCSDDEDQEDEAAIDDDEFLELMELGPKLPLKEQLEKDKEDESLRRWKEQLLGSASSCLLDHAGGGGDHGLLEPEVKVLRLGIWAQGREELELPLPLATTTATTTTNKARGYTFSLKEGCHYQLKFVFTVRNNIVSGLTCINNVWKAAGGMNSFFMVHHTRSMLGTFAPQQEPYVHIMPPQVTPSGLLARGSYTARKRFVDDDGTVYLDVNYSFEIRKDW
jgi:Rho GDP-dissociation inhibitor